MKITVAIFEPTQLRWELFTDKNKLFYSFIPVLDHVLVRKFLVISGETQPFFLEKSNYFYKFFSIEYEVLQFYGYTIVLG